MIRVLITDRLRDFSILRNDQTSFGTHPTLFNIWWVQGFFPYVKAGDARSWTLTSSSAEIKNEWSCTSAAPYVFILCTRKALLYELQIFVIYDILKTNVNQ